LVLAGGTKPLQNDPYLQAEAEKDRQARRARRAASAAKREARKAASAAKKEAKKAKKQDAKPGAQDNAIIR
jgi:hypothetical protein